MQKYKFFTNAVTNIDNDIYIIIGIAVFVFITVKPKVFIKILGVLLKILAKAKKFIKSFFRKKQNERYITIGKERLSDTARLRHTQVTGASGEGKTVLLKHQIKEDILRGNGVLIIDPKGDRTFFEWVRGACEKADRLDDLCLLSANYKEESVRWNPCRLGTVSELQTKWFNSGVYEEPFYAKACEYALLLAFTMLEKDKKGSYSITDLLEKLHLLVKSKEIDKIEGLFYELNNFAGSEWREIITFEENTDTQKEISLIDITRKNKILFVDLPTEAGGVQNRRIGKLLLQEIMLISGLRKAYPEINNEKPFSVFIDEFDAFATENFVTFLNKGRSSNFMIHIAHQTLSDLDKISPFFRGQIMGNTNIRFIFRQDNPDDAEELARYLGTVNTTKKTYQSENGNITGKESIRDTREFIIHPQTIKTLGTGNCILSIKNENFIKKIKIPYPVTINSKTKKPYERGRLKFDSFEKKDFNHNKDKFSELIET